MEEKIFKIIFQLSNRIQMEGDKLSKELTLKQWFLLLILCKGANKSPTIHDISSVMGVTRQSTKKMVSILERGGYLSVNKSPSDSRALCVRPTEKTCEFFRKNKSLGFGLLDIMFEGIEEKEMAVTLEVLQKILSNLQDMRQTEQ